MSTKLGYSSMTVLPGITHCPTRPNTKLLEWLPFFGRFKSDQTFGCVPFITLRLRFCLTSNRPSATLLRPKRCLWQQGSSQTQRRPPDSFLPRRGQIKSWGKHGTGRKPEVSTSLYHPILAGHVNRVCVCVQHRQWTCWVFCSLKTSWNI